MKQYYPKAYECFKKAADQGELAAMNNLSYMYRNGYGVPKDYKKAYAYYKVAAESGIMSAQYNLGNSYRNSVGVQQNFAYAAVWYMKAAKQGHRGAQIELGHLYRTGKGVSQDYQKAYAYYRKADQGDKDALKSMKEVWNGLVNAGLNDLRKIVLLEMLLICRRLRRMRSSFL